MYKEMREWEHRVHCVLTISIIIKKHTTLGIYVLHINDSAVIRSYY